MASPLLKGIILPETNIQNGSEIAGPLSSTNEAGDNASGEDTFCDATLCGVDEFVSFNTCEICPPGTTNAAGDEASGPDTFCDEVE